MKIKRTDRGFSFADFKDCYGVECSIQESSSVIPCIWLGANDNRMHLTQTMVSNLLPVLQFFVKHGYLPAPRKVGCSHTHLRKVLEGERKPSAELEKKMRRLGLKPGELRKEVR